MILPALQQPQWPDRAGLDAVRSRLEGLPPLVLAAECDQLKERLASVACGEAFLLQGGDPLSAWKFPAMMTFRHASVGTSSLNRIASSSRLVLPAR